MRVNWVDFNFIESWWNSNLKSHINKVILIFCHFIWILFNKNIMKSSSDWKTEDFIPVESFSACCWDRTSHRAVINYWFYILGYFCTRKMKLHHVNHYVYELGYRILFVSSIIKNFIIQWYNQPFEIYLILS